MTDYALLTEQMDALAEGVRYEMTLLSNFSALLYETLPDLNWCGFYLYRDGKLILGPFQGKTACTEIPLGRGVCGNAAQEDRTLTVADVHSFPGHIACDSASNSEIVIPLHKNGCLYGVLDIDSPLLRRFDRETEGLQQAAAVIEKHLQGAI